jgi:hypothetical protein
VIVFDDLLGDPLGHLGLFVAAAGGADVDRDGAQRGLAGSQRSSLSDVL